MTRRRKESFTLTASYTDDSPLPPGAPRSLGSWRVQVPAKYSSEPAKVKVRWRYPKPYKQNPRNRDVSQRCCAGLGSSDLAPWLRAELCFVTSAFTFISKWQNWRAGMVQKWQNICGFISATMTFHAASSRNALDVEPLELEPLISNPTFNPKSYPNLIEFLQVRVSLNLHGLVSVDSATAVEEEEYEETVKPSPKVRNPNAGPE